SPGAAICAPSRNFWATPAFPPHRSIPGSTPRACSTSTTPRIRAPERSDERSDAMTTRKTTNERTAGAPVLLTGGNPQIAKGYGEAPVRAYLDAMPGWKADIGRRIDAIVTRTVPGVRKA